MDSRAAAVQNTSVYEDFEASSDVVQEKDGDTILLNLPGFRKELLKVQLTSSKTLRISGSRPIGDNKWKSFQKEFPVSPDHDTQKISAKFESGILYVRLPKLIPPVEKKEVIPPVEKKEVKQDSKLPASDPITPPHQKPADQPPAQKGSIQEQASQKPAPKDDPSEQTNAQNVKEQPKAAKEKNVEPTYSEKKAKKSPDEKASGLDATKQRSIEGDKREDDSAKKPPEEKTSGRDDSKKKSIAADKWEDDSAKAVEKREKESTETVDGSGKSRARNYKETAVDVASKLGKHRRIFTLALVVIFGLAIGLHMTNFIRSLKRNES